MVDAEMLTKMLSQRNPVELVVLALVLYKALDILRLIYIFFLRGSKKLRKYGEWAVVTGATDGIGKAYCFELAKQGMSVLLVSRTEEKMVEVEEALKSKYPKLKFDHLLVDFAAFDATTRTAVKEKLKPLDIGVLVNNVGLSYPFTRYFHELQDDDISGLLQLNVSSTTWMTRIVLGDVDENCKPTSGMLERRRGAIVNTSSAAARAISPLLAGYSGAKSFVEMFSKGLAEELRPKGIDVQVQTPLYVTTKMAKIRNTSLTVPSPEGYVRYAVRQIGYGPVISPYWAHALQLWVMSLLPDAVGIFIVNRMHQDIRRRGMKKEKAKREESKKGE